MADPLPLEPLELLCTTRAVRRRLDLSQPVPDDLIRTCVEVALQAPTGSNSLATRFVVVRDPQKRSAIASVYRRCYESYRQMDGIYIGSIEKATEAEQRQQDRSARSADFLAEHLAEVPCLVLTCFDGMRLDGVPAMMSAAVLGSVLPAAWSFMIAARLHGLGTAWTTMHLSREAEVAEILGIPFDRVQQVCLTPLAYTQGTRFHPTLRPAADQVIGWDQWEPLVGP